MEGQIMTTATTATATATATKTRTTRKPAAAASTAKAKPAAVKKAEPVAPAPVEKAQPPTRSTMLARLAELGYTGPTSYTATVLRDVVLPWLEAGAPEGDDSIPAGVRLAIYPEAKAARTKRLSKGYLAACADVLALLDSNGDVRDLVTQALATGEATA